jgi:hypothetical protein
MSESMVLRCGTNPEWFGLKKAKSHEDIPVAQSATARMGFGSEQRKITTFDATEPPRHVTLAKSRQQSNRSASLFFIY